MDVGFFRSNDTFHDATSRGVGPIHAVNLSQTEPFPP